MIAPENFLQSFSIQDHPGEKTTYFEQEVHIPYLSSSLGRDGLFEEFRPSLLI